MAKKITLLIFLVALIAGSIFQSAYLLSICEEYSSLLEEMKKSLERDDFARLDVLCDDISKKYDDSRNILASLLQHGELDLLGIEIASLQVAVSSRDKYEISLAISRVCFSAAQISDMDKTGIENIL